MTVTIQRPTDWGNMGYPQWNRNILVNGELAGYCWGDNEQYASPNSEYWATLCWGQYEGNRINFGRRSRYGPTKDALLTLRDVRRVIHGHLCVVEVAA